MGIPEIKWIQGQEFSVRRTYADGKVTMLRSADGLTQRTEVMTDEGTLAIQTSTSGMMDGFIQIKGTMMVSQYTLRKETQEAKTFYKLMGMGRVVGEAEGAAIHYALANKFVDKRDIRLMQEANGCELGQDMVTFIATEFAKNYASPISRKPS